MPYRYETLSYRIHPIKLPFFRSAFVSIEVYANFIFQSRLYQRQWNFLWLPVSLLRSVYQKASKILLTIFPINLLNSMDLTFFVGLSLQCYECLKPTRGVQYPDCTLGKDGAFGKLKDCDEGTKECSISVQKYDGMGTFQPFYLTIPCYTKIIISQMYPLTTPQRKMRITSTFVSADEQ